MTSQPASGNTGVFTFRRVTGESDRALVAVDSNQSRVGDFLIARWIWLDDRTELRQLRVAPGKGRNTGYERLDNEILAGRRLHEVTEGVGYPPVLSHLYGDEAESVDPYALLEPYRGEPLHAVVGQMMKGEQLAFEVGLLTGLCWLEVAGIAHRGLSPSTVRWDGRRQQAQITDFSMSTVFRVPREAIGPADWVGPEQRPGEKAGGLVTERDDMHAAGRLIYYVRSQGEQLQSTSQLAGDAFADLGPFFGQPDRRPTARALLARRPGVGDPIPRGFSSDALLKGGYERFDFWRQDKHPGLSGPDGRSAGSGAAKGAPGRLAPTQMPRESAQTGPVVSEAAVSWEAADQDKRSWWRRGGRS
jgi:serine/threonine protein kinase